MSELILDRFAPIGQAGSGGFAKVIHAYDTELTREVAIKVIPLDSDAAQAHMAATQVMAPPSVSILGKDDGGVGTPSAVDLESTPGLKEARAASTLDDPTIVKIHDFRQQGNLGYLIMEYVDGVSVADLLTKCPDRLDADVIAVIFKAVAKALQVAHSKGVLHLDIKPANVLVTPKGQVKVVDFGLARLMDESGFGSAASGGTIGYMPPEQMRQEELDQRCDEWALAALTYQLIAHENPFIVSSLDEAEDSIYGAEIFVPSAFRSDIDESIDDILFCALDPDREHRYDTVKAFAKEVQPCLGDLKQGRPKLREMVSYLKGQVAQEETTDEIDPEQVVESAAQVSAAKPSSGIALPNVPLVDMLSARARGIVRRVCAVVGTALLGFVAVNNIPATSDWSDPVAWGLFGLLLLASALLPSVGALASCVAFSVALIMHGGIASGVALIVMSSVWWFVTGRHSNASACVVLGVPLLGIIGGMPLAPLVAGWCLRPKNAVVTTAASVVLSFALATLGSASLFGWAPFSYWQIHMWTDLGTTCLFLVTDPQMWVMAVAFVLSSGVMSILCYLGHNRLSYVGAIMATLVQVAGLLASRLALTQGLSFVPDTASLLSVITAGIVMVIFCVAGCPQSYDREFSSREN